MEDPRPFWAASAVIGEILGAVREHLGVDLSFLAELTPHEKVVQATDGAAAEFDLEAGTRLARGETYCSLLVTDDIDSVIADTAEEPAVRELAITAGAGIGAYVGVPVYTPRGACTAPSAGSLTTRPRACRDGTCGSSPSWRRSSADSSTTAPRRVPRRLPTRKRWRRSSRAEASTPSSSRSSTCGPARWSWARRSRGSETGRPPPSGSRRRTGPAATSSSSTSPSPRTSRTTRRSPHWPETMKSFAERVSATLVAEGIETSGALRALQSRAIDCGQGYYLGRPGPLPLACAVGMRTATL